MDERFDSEVMQDLAGETPPSSADEEYLEGAETEGFEEDGFEEEAMDDELSGFEEGAEDSMEDAGFEDEFAEGYQEDSGDAYGEDEADLMDAVEEVMADALDAEDSDEFIGGLIGGLGSIGRLAGGLGSIGRLAGGLGSSVGRLAGAVGRGARAVRGAAGVVRRGTQVAGRAARVAGRAGRVARKVRRALPRRGMGGTMEELPPGAQDEMPRPQRRGLRMAPPAGGVAAILSQLLPILRQHAAQGSSEMDVFEDLADWFEEEDVDAALPIIAGVAARAAVRPIMRRTGATLGQAAARRVVRGATQAAQTLVQRQGPPAVRALHPIARSVGRTAARQGVRPGAVGTALRQTAARVAARPALTQRLAQPGSAPARMPPGPSARSGTPRRLMVSGPVEIVIRR